MTLLVALAVSVIFGAGAHLMLRRDAVRVAAGTVLMTNAAVLLLMGGGFEVSRAPLLPLDPLRSVADPLVQALALTAIVISFGTTILLLRLVAQIAASHESVQLDALMEAELETLGPAGEDSAEAPRAADAVSDAGVETRSP